VKKNPILQTKTPYKRDLYQGPTPGYWLPDTHKGYMVGVRFQDSRYFLFWILEVFPNEFGIVSWKLIETYCSHLWITPFIQKAQQYSQKTCSHLHSSNSNEIS